MEFSEQLMAIAILVDFLFGVLIGIVLSVSYASRLEDRCYTLLTAAPNPICGGSRSLLGIYVRGRNHPAGLRAGRVDIQRVPSGRDPDRRGTDPDR